MVSLRRRRYLGLCSGKDVTPVDIPKPIENGKPVENTATPHTKPFSVHPLPTADFDLKLPINSSETLPSSSNASGSSSAKEEPNNYYPGKEIKRRKRHRRKQYEDQEPCIMRGVYFKNMKWQAAIKVDKKQIHLGTVGSQEAAAQLYDRAAFMCGREPNFELSEEEKQELTKYTWESFLAMTRIDINSKKIRRKPDAGTQRKTQVRVHDDRENKIGKGGSLLFEDGDANASAS